MHVHSHTLTENIFGISNDVNTPRNYVKARIGPNAVQYRCLVDSGADRNVMRKDTAQKLHIRINPVARGSRRLSAANSSTIEVAGTAIVPIQLNEFYTESEFIIVSQLQHPVILGTTFLQENNACVDFVDSSLIIGKERTIVPLIERVAEGDVVRMASDISIPPMYEAFVRVNVEPSLVDGIYVVEPLIDAYRAGIQHGALVARACVNVLNHSTICRVLNITDETITIKKNRAIAYVSETQDADIDSLDQDPEGDVINEVKEQDQVETGSRSHAEKLEELDKYGFKLERDGLTEKQFEELVSLIYDYRIVFDEKIVGVKDFEYHIDFKPGQSPRRVKQYYHNPLVRKEIDKQLAEWEKDGLIEKGPYKYAWPLVAVRRKCRCVLKLKGQPRRDEIRLDTCNHPPTFRVCSDMRGLNSSVEVRPFFNPGIQQLSDSINDPQGEPKRIFTVLDSRSGFLQLRLDEESRQYCGIQTETQSYRYCTLAFGMVASGFEYQRITSKIFDNILGLWLFAFVDDLLISSKDIETHMVHLRAVFERLQKYQLRIKAAKSVFCKREILYIGNYISSEGIRPDPRKIDLISKLKPPENTRALRSFLALMSYFKRFIYRFSDRISIFRPLLKKNAKFEWNEARNDRFKELTSLLKTSPIYLYHARFDRPFVIIADSSKTACGYILCNRLENNELRPILFGSRLWAESEMRLHSACQELLGIVHAVTQCHRYLSGRSFEIITDSISSTYIKTLSRTSGPMFRLALKLASYDFEIKHLRGQQMPADFLSRQFIAGDETQEDKVELETDECVFNLDEGIKSGTQTCTIQIHGPSGHATCYVADRIHAPIRTTTTPDATIVNVGQTTIGDNRPHDTLDSPHECHVIDDSTTRTTTTDAASHQGQDQTDNVSNETPVIDDVTASRNIRQIEIRNKYTAEQWREMTLSCPEYGPMLTYLELGDISESVDCKQGICFRAEQYEVVDGLLYHIKRQSKNKRTQRTDKILQLAVPKDKQNEIIEVFHRQLGHARVQRLYATMLHSVYFQRMYSKIREVIEACQHCILANKNRPPRVPLTHPEPVSVGERVYLDLLTLCPTFDPVLNTTVSSVLVTIDETSRFIVAVPIPDMKAQTIATLFEREYLALFGFPRFVNADLGPCFVSDVFKQLMTKYGIALHFSAAARHCSQGHVEKANHQLTSALQRMIMGQNQGNWLDMLPAATLALNSTSSTIHPFSAFELFFGRRATNAATLALPQDPIQTEQDDTIIKRAENADNAVGQAQELSRENRLKMDKYYSHEVKSKTFKKDQVVLLYRPAVGSGKSEKLWPGYRLVKIVEELPYDSYRLADAYSGQPLPYVYHCDRLKPTCQPAVDQTGQKVTREPSTEHDRPETIQKGKTDRLDDTAGDKRVKRQTTVPQSEWFAVNRIIKRRRGNTGLYQYLVEWQDNSPATWLEAKNISKEAMQSFYARLKRRRRRQ